ncbi:sigma factor-like helix-turn-helix DNA-binding protein [Paenibacillus sp. FSL H7-0357]|uniref:sigma factor-like helix-turn-helix DNA-binding protein n=1 Tax=unclassified Paenibacillus TaxID=185978 RepID=UPI0009E05DC8|nr:sigma factor-like helix-turn-helix DNA-binding protein [Paenibacillus sp. FSL H7-0357]
MTTVRTEKPALPYTRELEGMLSDYQDTLKVAECAYVNADADDRKIISGMVSDCKYIIEWLTTGRRPGNRRGIERRAGYEREILLEPLRMQLFTSSDAINRSDSITDDRRSLLDFALEPLSKRERECYMMAHGEGFSHACIAEMLGISAGSVSEYIQRAQRKISPLVNEIREFV